MGIYGNVRIAILFKDELHPAHEGFADAIGADRVSLPPIGHDLLRGSVIEDFVGVLRRVRSIPTDYDIYLSEDVAGLYAGSYLAKRTDAVNVHLAADHRIFGFNGYDTDRWGPFTVAKWADRATDIAIIRRLLRNHVDGVVAVSGLVERHVDRIAPDVPVRTVTPYIETRLFERLGEVRPPLAETHAVFVGKNRAHKGVDMLCRAWPQVRQSHPDATLSLVGREHIPNDIDGVTVAGYVDDIADAYRSASLYVHPARFEAFGVAVIEAMRAGVPAITTTTCGATAYLSEIDSKLECDPAPDDIARAVMKYFDRGLDRRSELSRTVRRTASVFDPVRSRRAFVEQFFRLIGDITATTEFPQPA